MQLRPSPLMIRAGRQWPPRPRCRRRVLLGRGDDRRLLPALLSGAAAAQERALLCVGGGGAAGRVPRLQALPSRPGGHVMTVHARRVRTSARPAIAERVAALAWDALAA